MIIFKFLNIIISLKLKIAWLKEKKTDKKQLHMSGMCLYFYVLVCFVF